MCIIHVNEPDTDQAGRCLISAVCQQANSNHSLYLYYLSGFIRSSGGGGMK